MGPAGTPKAIIDRLNAEINKVITRPDVKEAWDQQGAVPLVMTPGEFETYLRADIEKWAQVVRTAGLRAKGGRPAAATARATRSAGTPLAGYMPLDIACPLQRADNIRNHDYKKSPAGKPVRRRPCSQ